MSNSTENQEIFLDDKTMNNLNSISDIIQNSSFNLNNNLSSISTGKFFERFTLLCKGCGEIPILNFMENLEKIIFICKCSNYSQKELTIKVLFSDYLFDKFEDPDKTKLNSLKCNLHPNERYF